MTRVPKSLQLALRDLAIIGAVAFGTGLLLIRTGFRQDAARFAEAYGWAVTELGVDEWPIQPATQWALGVLLWALAIWCATRARAGTRWVWLPVALATLWVAVQSVCAFGPWDGALWAFDWPGPVTPVTYTEVTGDIVPVPDWSFPPHAGWAFPPVVIGLLALAAVLGARAGRLPDDAAARHVTTPARSGLALTAVVVGLPALGGVAGAVTVYLAVNRDPWMPFGLSVDLLRDLVLVLAAALLAAALLSGTGPLGAIATLLVAAPVVWASLGDWMGGTARDVVLLESLAVTVAVLVVSFWRPCALWAGELLGPARVPPAARLPG